MEERHRAVVHDMAQMASQQGVELFLVGAVARDKLFANSETPHAGRKTFDVDFACRLKDWQDYEELIRSLEGTGLFTRSARCRHQVIHTPTGTPVDLVPFGKIESEDHLIVWPPDGELTMDVSGFSSAFENGIPMEEGTLRRVGPEWYAMLKLNTWLESPNRGKDVDDFHFLVGNYVDIIGDDRFFDSESPDSDLPNLDDFDYDLAGVRILGRDCARMDAGFAGNLVARIFDSPRLADLQYEMGKCAGNSALDAEELLNTFRLGIEDILSQDVPGVSAIL